MDLIWNLLILSAFPWKIPSVWQPKCLGQSHIRKWSMNTSSRPTGGLLCSCREEQSLVILQKHFLFLFISSLRQQWVAWGTLGRKHEVVPVGERGATCNVERKTIRQMKDKYLLTLPSFWKQANCTGQAAQGASVPPKMLRRFSSYADGINVTDAQKKLMSFQPRFGKVMGCKSVFKVSDSTLPSLKTS